MPGACMNARSSSTGLVNQFEKQVITAGRFLSHKLVVRQRGRTVVGHTALADSLGRLAGWGVCELRPFCLPAGSALRLALREPGR